MKRFRIWYRWASAKERNSRALTMELRLSGTNPSIYEIKQPLLHSLNVLWCYNECYHMTWNNGQFWQSRPNLVTFVLKIQAKIMQYSNHDFCFSWHEIFDIYISGIHRRQIRMSWLLLYIKIIIWWLSIFLQIDVYQRFWIMLNRICIYNIIL